MSIAEVRQIPQHAKARAEAKVAEERLSALRREWRKTALRAWLRGTKLVALIIAAVLIPLFVVYMNHAGGVIWRLADIFHPLGVFFLGPATAVVLTMIALGGPNGTERLHDLKTIPGGPTEWFRALLFSARVVAAVSITLWGIAACFAFEGFNIRGVLPALLYPHVFIWSTGWVVGSARLSNSIPVLSGVLIWARTMWPCVLLARAASVSCPCQIDIITSTLLMASPFVYVLQAGSALRSVRQKLDVLSSASD